MQLFDLHCDTATVCEQHRYSLFDNPFHFDTKRASSYFDRCIQTAAIYIPDETPAHDAWTYFQRTFSYLKTTNKGEWTVIDSPQTLTMCRYGFLLAVENGIVIGHDLKKIRELAIAGVTYITLTWNGSNLIGNGCLSTSKSGLTSFGKTAVSDMYRYGILPDVSHLNEAGFWDVVDLSDGRSFIASHSVSDAVHSHPRNLSDAQFRAVCESGGLVGLNLCFEQLGEQTFEQIERHAYHFWSLDGHQNVVLGMDLDGTVLPDEWNGIEAAARLYEYFLQRSYPQELIDALFFKNSYSFFMKSLTSKDKCIRIGA